MMWAVTTAAAALTLSLPATAVYAAEQPAMVLPAGAADCVLSHVMAASRCEDAEVRLGRPERPVDGNRRTVQEFPLVTFLVEGTWASVRVVGQMSARKLGHDSDSYCHYWGWR